MAQSRMAAATDVGDGDVQLRALVDRLAQRLVDLLRQALLHHRRR